MTPDTSIAVSTQTAIARVRPTAIADLSPIVAEANSIAISNADSYQSADLFLFRVRQAIKKGESLIDPIKKPINEAKAAVMKLEHDLLDPLKIAEATVKQRMAQWQIEDRRRVEDERRRIQDEQNRIAKEAEDKRREADHQRQVEADAARRAQEARTTQARLQAQREAEEAFRRSMKAEQQASALDLKLERAESAPVPEVVKAAGSKVVEVRKWRLEQPDGLKILNEAVYAGDVPLEAITTNDRYIEAEFQKDRGVVTSWPGLELWIETRVSGR